jgi:hypothetical protein
MSRTGGRSTGKMESLIPRPPPLSGYEITHSVRVRFQANAAIALAITYADLLDTFLVASSAVQGYDVFYAVRIDSISIWCNAAVGSSAAVNLLFAGVTAGSVGDQDLHNAVSMGIEPAYVRARPSPRSLGADFQLSSQADAFNLYCPNGSVIDCSLTLRGAYATQLAAQNALVGAVAGVFYLRGLDGLAVATTKLAPIYAQAVI